MPTYRILDQDGVVVDKSQQPSDIPDDELIKMYTDMLSVSSECHNTYSTASSLF
jgi:2-oxoisovalerate dehydrogenase E1 component alpha subunit